MRQRHEKNGVAGGGGGHQGQSVAKSRRQHQAAKAAKPAPRDAANRLSSWLDITASDGSTTRVAEAPTQTVLETYLHAKS
jgi:hypothetical protein